MAVAALAFRRNKPLVELHYEAESPCPGWYARHWRDGKTKEFALSIWNPSDLEAARSEATKVFSCSADRIAVVKK